MNPHGSFSAKLTNSYAVLISVVPSALTLTGSDSVKRNIRVSTISDFSIMLVSFFVIIIIQNITVTRPAHLVNIHVYYLSNRFVVFL